ncbi:ferredoxin [Streptomyces sp. NPDC017405]|uniref:ferredoxin n=1 Tax=unclassified Streptomyces TaxID=2593676 RepID=UPI0037B48E2E
MAHVTADTSRCIGAGRCVSIAPEIFDQTNSGSVMVIHASPERDEVDLVFEAVDLCPARALSVSDD